MTIWLWVGFVAFILVMLALDLLVVNRRAHVFGAGESLAWTAFCVVLALAFGAGVFWIYDANLLGIAGEAAGREAGAKAAQEYFTGWLLEYALSLDNIMVFALVFTYFRVPPRHQHRVLFWGVLGALLLRGVMILAGAALLARFHWMIHVFGVVLLLTAAKMLVIKEEGHDLSRNPVVRLLHRYLPVADRLHGQRFFVREGGRWIATPMFVVLVVVELTDVVFAVDSIPAVFAVTRDPFIVFTSNVFAILGLRSLYFALSAIIHRFRYVRTALIFVLTFIGVKMIIEGWYDIPTGVSLAVVGGLIAVGLVSSLLSPGVRRGGVAWPEGEEEEAPIDQLAELAEFAWRRSRRIAVAIIGVTIILFGLIVGVLPFVPGIPIMILGFMLLATEFLWARAILKNLKSKATALAEQARLMVGGESKPAPRREPETGGALPPDEQEALTREDAGRL